MAAQYFQTIQEQGTKMHEQNVKIKQLEKRVAQMKGSTKIQEEIIALKTKRAENEKKMQEKICALEAERTKADRELETERTKADKELGECESELKMAEEDDEESQ
jgi:Skp family chaperone for outer membrane proteins